MKKGLLLGTIAASLTIACGAGFVLANNNGVRFEVAKATDKSFTFDRAVGANQFEGHYTDQKPAEISVATGVSSNLETRVRLPKNSTDDFGKYFGDTTYNSFVKTSETFSSAAFEIDIGVNNPTSVSVNHKLIKTTYTAATEVGCRITVFNGETELDTTYTSGDACINNDWTFTWTKKGTQETPANRVRIEVEPKGGTVYWGEPLLINSITLNWSC